MFSPKRCVRMAFACSEPVPGTAREVERRPGRRAVENSPTTTTAPQHRSTATRRRTTARAQRSSMGSEGGRFTWPSTVSQGSGTASPGPALQFHGQAGPRRAVDATATLGRDDSEASPPAPADRPRPCTRVGTGGGCKPRPWPVTVPMANLAGAERPLSSRRLGPE